MAGFHVLAAVVGAENTRRRDRHEDALRVCWVEDDGMESHAAGARLPEIALGAAQSGQFLPGLASVAGLKQRGILGAGEDGIGIGERRLEMPDALEFPRMLRAVVPLVRARRALVFEFVADGFPSFAAVIGALHLLAEPSAGLRGIKAIRRGGRTLEVIHLPTRKERAGDFPIGALAIGGEDECPLRVPARIRTRLVKDEG